MRQLNHLEGHIGARIMGVRRVAVMRAETECAAAFGLGLGGRALKAGGSCRGHTCGRGLVHEGPARNATRPGIMCQFVNQCLIFDHISLFSLFFIVV
jgi:hypothetical protein